MYLICILISIIGYCIYRRIQWMKILAKNGIPGPKPSLITGNSKDFKGMSSIDRQKIFTDKYGKVMGFYNGGKPIVMVSDPELAKNIQIKDFQYFYDRQHMVMRNGMDPQPMMSGAVHRSRGQRWKQIRSVLTPTFSASKLKTMTPIMDDCINTFVDLVDKQSESEFDIYELFQGLTTDVIGRTAFGIQTDVQRDPNNKFLKAAKDVFNTQMNRWFVRPINCFPQLDHILYPYRRLNESIRHLLGYSPTGILLDMSRDIIHLRKTDPKFKRKDLLQLMIDTKLSHEEMSHMSDETLTASTDQTVKEVKSNDLSEVKNVLNKNTIRLSEDEIKANCVLFFEAGYETTSTALAFATHFLVNNPEVQEKVREEVKELYESEGKLDFNTVAKLQYMESVLNESMRIYPPIITFVTRETIEDYKYKDIVIPKGASIQFPTYIIHHDPDYWPEPEKFDPDRFSAQRKHQINPSSFQPFGSGPRNCIGMRFAFFEMKLCLAKLLMKFRLEPGPKTQLGKLTTECKLVSLAPKYGVFVKAVKIF